MKRLRKYSIDTYHLHQKINGDKLMDSTPKKNKSISYDGSLKTYKMKKKNKVNENYNGITKLNINNFVKNASQFKFKTYKNEVLVIITNDEDKNVDILSLKSDKKMETNLHTFENSDSLINPGKKKLYLKVKLNKIFYIEILRNINAVIIIYRMYQKSSSKLLG